MFSADCTEATRRFRKLIGFKSGVGCITYLISKLSRVISQALANQYLSAWFTPQTERVVVLSKILALNNCLALLLSLLLVTSIGTIAIEQNRSRIGCHNNFVKAKDASSRVETDLGICHFTYKCFLSTGMLQCLPVHPIATDVEENPGPTMFYIIDPTCADSSFFFFI